MVFLVPLFVALGGAKAEGAAEVDDDGAGGQEFGREVHGDFGGGGEKNSFQAFVCNGFGGGGRAADGGFADQFGGIAGVRAVVEEDGFAVGVADRILTASAPL